MCCETGGSRDRWVARQEGRKTKVSWELESDDLSTVVKLVKFFGINHSNKKKRRPTENIYLQVKSYLSTNGGKVRHYLYLFTHNIFSSQSIICCKDASAETEGRTQDDLEQPYKATIVIKPYAARSIAIMWEGTMCRETDMSPDWCVVRLACCETSVSRD
jgi:allantoicase